MSNFLKINDLVLPPPSRGLNIKRNQRVDSDTDALGRVIAQKINRRMIDFNNLKWNYLDADTWKSILIEIEKYEGTLTFHNMLTDRYEEIKVCWGNSTEIPFEIDENGKVISYTDCSCNLTDMGYEAVEVVV